MWGLWGRHANWSIHGSLKAPRNGGWERAKQWEKKEPRRPQLQTPWLFLSHSFQFMNIYFIAPSKAVNGSINKTVWKEEKGGVKGCLCGSEGSEGSTLSKPCHNEVHCRKISFIISLGYELNLAIKRNTGCNLGPPCNTAVYVSTKKPINEHKQNGLFLFEIREYLMQ